MGKNVTNKAIRIRGEAWIRFKRCLLISQRQTYVYKGTRKVLRDAITGSLSVSHACIALQSRENHEHGFLLLELNSGKFHRHRPFAHLRSRFHFAQLSATFWYIDRNNYVQRLNCSFGQLSAEDDRSGRSTGGNLPARSTATVRPRLKFGFSVASGQAFPLVLNFDSCTCPRETARAWNSLAAIFGRFRKDQSVDEFRI